MTTWERNVTEVVWESQTTPGVTWLTVVGTSESTPAVRLLPTPLGNPGQVAAVRTDGTGTEWVDQAGGGGGLSDDQPLPLGAASPGVSDEASRSDHRHPMPSASDVGAATPASVTSAIADAKTELRGTAPANGDTLGELHDRIAVVEALGSLATDAELIAAVTALIGSADPSGDTLGELQALIGARLAKAANLADLSNPATARTNLGLGNVDDTSDADKPVSTATQAALDLKAPLASPALTGTPTAPTAAPGTNTTQIATTAFVLANAPSSSGFSTTFMLMGA